MLCLGGVSPLLSLLLLGFAAATPDLFDTQQGDINYCKKQCQIAVKIKSSDKDAVLNACHRGCLLFSICQFVNGNAGFNTSREECQGACQEAYSRQVEQEACNKGCGSQPSEAKSRRRKLKALAHQSRPSTVMDTFSSWCSDIISSAQSLISSTWTFYLQADDGKVVVFQSQPETEYTFPELQAPRSDVADKSWPPASSHTQRPHTGVRQHGAKGVSKVEGKLKHFGQHADSPPTEHDFLGCMSRRSGLPRWILAACLFLSVMVMLWLSCASLVTAPDQHVKSQVLCAFSFGGKVERAVALSHDTVFQLSINGDKEFLEDPAKVHVSPVIAVAMSPPDPTQETGPLPLKVDLSKTIL